MRVRTNQSMLELLGGDPEFYEPNEEPVPTSLLDELQGGFKEVDGCVVPQSFGTTSIWAKGRPRENNVDDETGFECGLSKVHLDELVDSSVSLSELARIGLAYAFYIKQALLRSPVTGEFRIIVDAQVPDSELHVGNCCSVRFHKIRPHQVWLSEDLESYKLDALLVVDFATP